ncbi:MAG TPA: exo-beta-N-acetylmuramidase NamZ domain-containing protein [Isosphaeraceae bacterium]|jgi:uncharacterized protein YbbC (DUF1343 family)|nr:exo-beta-N-acetylmuramidase NamZ domain-containing protein [Isosphaeraceae bacterium]
MDSGRLARIDAAVGRAIEAKRVPGAVVLVGRAGKVIFAKAYGKRAIEPAEEGMTRDTIFDMASLTKPVATATSVTILVESGKLRLGDPIRRHLPELDTNGKGAITVEQLLRHRSGLIADNPIDDYKDGPERAWEKIAGLEPVAKPGERFVYSDVNYIILGKLVGRVSGRPLDEFAAEHIFQPLGMADTGFRPAGKTDRIAPTEKADGTMLRGVVHDPRARALGGVAGHAGLFGTADDLAVFAQMILDGGRGPGGSRVLGPLAVRAMIDPGDTPRGQRRGLGWDISTPYSAPRGALLGPESFGHTGFTGTSLWIDPETRTFVIVLTSRLHPDGKAPSPNPLRAELATIVASAIVDAPIQEPARPVACGIDVLIARGFEPLKGKRVGLITNQTGRARDGRATIDVLAHAPGVRLVKLFSPEHGIRGVLDAPVDDAKDEATGLPIVSLYGKTRRPTSESLEDVDVLAYDIQDIGARFYTYITTLGYAIEAAKAKGIPIVVLDRPNPIGGVVVDGPVRDEEFASFIAYHALPLRHGMTVGELARLYNAERSIGADLTVIPCEGWRRGDLYDATGLVWVDPSPNIRNLNEALLYPGVCLLEATELAHGRGTNTPFERVGAPWIEPRSFARALNDLDLPGVRFVPIRFTPRARQHAGHECGGVQILITDRARLDPIAVGIALAVVLQRDYPGRWGDAGFLRLVADRATHKAVLDGKGLDEVRSVWSKDLAEFRAIREKYLLYP